MTAAGKGYSVTDGLGPLTNIWRTAAQRDHDSHRNRRRRHLGSIRKRQRKQHRRWRRGAATPQLRQRSGLHQQRWSERFHRTGQLILQICAALALEHQRNSCACARPCREPDSWDRWWLHQRPCGRGLAHATAMAYVVARALPGIAHPRIGARREPHPGGHAFTTRCDGWTYAGSGRGDRQSGHRHQCIRQSGGIRTGASRVDGCGRR